MRITAISDLHGHYPQLEGGDLLIVAGDLTARDSVEEYLQFYEWLDNQDYKKKVVISGNHDNELQKEKYNNRNDRFYPAVYLCDSGTEFENLKIWGSPWTKRFKGMNPNAMAFTVETEEELAEKWDLIPGDIDILVTHVPAYSCLDISLGAGEYLGSPSLRLRLKELFMKGNRMKLHVCGHIHERYGKDGDGIVPIRINASHVNERYEPVNKPITVEL